MPYYKNYKKSRLYSGTV